MGKRGSCKTCLENECLMKQFFFCRISFFQSPPVCPWDGKKRETWHCFASILQKEEKFPCGKEEYARVFFPLSGRRNLLFASSEFPLIFESSRRLPRTAKRIFFPLVAFSLFCGCTGQLGKNLEDCYSRPWARLFCAEILHMVVANCTNDKSAEALLSSCKVTPKFSHQKGYTQPAFLACTLQTMWQVSRLKCQTANL